MKAYRVELLVLDFDDIGKDGIMEEIENTRYGNHCISPSVMEIDCRDIGEWHDGHPLNRTETQMIEYRRWFHSETTKNTNGKKRGMDRSLKLCLKCNGSGWFTYDGKPHRCTCSLGQ